MTTTIHRHQNYLLHTYNAFAEVNIHRRVLAEDMNTIDQAASLIGANRSQFIFASALKDAKNILLDQTTIHVNAKQFNAILNWMDSSKGAHDATYSSPPAAFMSFFHPKAKKCSDITV